MRVWPQRLAHLAALALVCVWASCKPHDAAASKQRPPPLVVVARVVATDVRVTVRASIDLRPLALVDVNAKALGYLADVRVERGDVVRRGQLLATVRPSDLPDLLAASRGALAQNRVAIDLARQNVERLRPLAPRGIVSQQELQSAESSLARAEAEAASLRAQSAAVGTRLGETRITAPIDGVVLQRRVDPGALVGPSTGPVLTVARVDSLRAFVPVNERESAGVTVGAEATVSFDAWPDRTFTGRVVRLAPAFDPVTRTLDAEVHLDNREGLLRPGMYGRAEVVTAVHAHAATAPVGAIQITGERRVAFVLDGDKVHRREVVTGFDGGTWLEVTRGLSIGDEVVTAGLEGLSDNARVRVSRGAARDGGR
jgi:membrane fusion protein, multidrug efflux system